MPRFAIESSCLPWFDIPKDVDFIAFSQGQDQALKNEQNPPQCLISWFEDHMVLDAFDSSDGKYLQHQIDIHSFINQIGKSFPASKKNVFAQAIGKKTQTVLDATGGWLGDSLLMCSQNYQVTTLERFWLLQGFIKEACQRMQAHDWVQSNNMPVPELVPGSAIDLMRQRQFDVDCVYIDPMFPPKVKKSAAVRKSMRVLHDLVGQDVDAKELFEAAYESGIKRIVVKRPDYAEVLSQTIKPSQTISGKLVRYDVYLK